jgi:phospholipase A1
LVKAAREKNDDDNSDIQNFLGYGQLKIIKNFDYKKQISLKIIPGIKRAGYELNYSQPWKRGYRFYTKLSTGTGSSLLGYDHEGHKLGISISIGFILNDIVTSED